MPHNELITENLHAFENLVKLRYQIFNSVFLTLNLGQVHQTGILLPILSEYCKEGFNDGKDPSAIINDFMRGQKNVHSEDEALDMLFRMIQYIERQVVLIDALEDAAFIEVNDLTGPGSFHSLMQMASNRNMKTELIEALKDFKVRIVLTAHPTQFYPGSVLGIITDLAKTVQKNDIESIRLLLLQLGKTPFFKKQKPTPYDEAVSLGWYLENIFYDTIGQIHETIMKSMDEELIKTLDNPTWIELGFWPGGDRDGNPFVNVETTIQVADRLRNSVLKCYYRDLRTLKRNLTFKGVEEKVLLMEELIYKSIINQKDAPALSVVELLNMLEELLQVLIVQHDGLFAQKVKSLIYRVRIFGYHFATLDIRQDSSEIEKALEEIGKMKGSVLPSDFNKKSEADQTALLFSTNGTIHHKDFSDPIVADTIAVFPVMRQIQEKNGEKGAHRFIISNCQNQVHVASVFALAQLTGWKAPFRFDIVPLFETIEDLKTAEKVMHELYTNPVYREHLKNRDNRQVVMLGFSDGTKDGGYLSANWEIYQAKERITGVSRDQNIDVVFFDGRGGPPARGGGNTHKFYASLGDEIENKEIQLTIQGQTISSKFGTIESARHDIEQLLTAGLENKLFNEPERQLTQKDRDLINELSERSLEIYTEFKSDPLFLRYLEEMSTLNYYSSANIGSRPSKRNSDKKLSLSNLRAIPFVGAWSQLKQNVPGFYGLGSILREMETQGRLDEVSKLYNDSLFFRTLIENSMQSLCKTYFPLTQYMKDDPVFAGFWKNIFKEYEDSVSLILKISGQKVLLERSPAIRESIKLREEVVLPLLTIQQYGLKMVQQLEKNNPNDERIKAYRNLVVRSLFGNINASRNSA